MAKHIANLVDAASLHPRDAKASQSVMTQSDAKFIGMLFSQLKNIFPAWRVAFPTPESEAGARHEWSVGLIDANCTTREQLSRGLKKARLSASPWLPSVGMFIDWCKADGTEFGLPTEEEAYQQAVGNRREQHPAVIHTLRNMEDPHAFRTMAATDSRRLFAACWQKTVGFVETGGVFPKLEPKLEKTTSPADKAFGLQQIKSIINNL